MCWWWKVKKISLESLHNVLYLLTNRYHYYFCSANCCPNLETMFLGSNNPRSLNSLVFRHWKKWELPLFRIMFVRVTHTYIRNFFGWIRGRDGEPLEISPEYNIDSKVGTLLTRTGISCKFFSIQKMPKKQFFNR
jgi:hypothetical protein